MAVHDERVPDQRAAVPHPELAPVPAALPGRLPGAHGHVPGAGPSRAVLGPGVGRPAEAGHDRRRHGGLADYLYRLLPDVLAARIEELPPYEYFDREVQFYRVGADYLGGAELISWPPTSHQPKDKDDEDYGHPWLYSGVIRISVQTEPFSPVPRVHLSTGIRRWVHGRVSRRIG